MTVRHLPDQPSARPLQQVSVAPNQPYRTTPESCRLQDSDSQFSARDIAIAHSVYDCRLISGGGLERMHFNEHQSAATRARICRRVLKRLTEHDIIRRRSRRIGGMQSGSAAYIYSLGAHGARLMSSSRVHYYTHDPSDYFMRHTLAISELYVQFHEQGRHSCRLLRLETEPRCWRQFLTLATGTETLKPDLFVQLRVGNEERSYFIEVDRGTTYNTALLRKQRRYEQYYMSGREQQRWRVFPRVLWLVPNPRRASLLEQLYTPINRRIPGLCAVSLYSQALPTILAPP